MVHNELGDDPENVFASFDRQAFAAASLGQVHAARLKTGEPAAVKIQYPGMRERSTRTAATCVRCSFPRVLEELGRG